jgi:hypothetical protein
MTYATDQASVQGSAPRELYAFTIGGSAYNYTSCRDDISYGGVLYTAIQISRNNATAFETSRRRELIVTLPADNEIVGLLINSGIPRRKTGLIITSIEAGGDTIQVWSGRINGLNTQDEWAQLRVPNRTDDKFNLKLPVFKEQRLCNHILYGPGCTVSRAGHGPTIQPRYGSTQCGSASSDRLARPGAWQVVSSNGTDGRRSVCTGDFGQPTIWANGGELRIANSLDDSRSIISAGRHDVDARPAVLAAARDFGQTSRCGRAARTRSRACRDDFDNIRNFGGHPHEGNVNIIGPFNMGIRTGQPKMPDP